jgi:hypothetical protein
MSEAQIRAAEDAEIAQVKARAAAAIVEDTARAQADRDHVLFMEAAEAASRKARQKAAQEATAAAGHTTFWTDIENFFRWPR